MSTKKPAPKKKESSRPAKLTCDDVFNLMDFDSDGKITVSELKEAVLACGIPADRIDMQTHSDYFLQTAGGKVDLKSFKNVCKELKPETTSATEFYDKQFKILAIDQDGLIDIDAFKSMLKGMGQKLSETNINIFLKQIKKEEGNKIKVSNVVEKLAALNVLV